MRLTLATVRGILKAWISSSPAFGDEVGLRRLHRAAVERTRELDMPEADKRA